MVMGLFQKWFELEKKSGRTVKAILCDLNNACGTKYRETWPNVIAARGYKLERCPTEVRQYMMTKVLAAELELHGLTLSPKKISSLVVNLT